MPSPSLSTKLSSSPRAVVALVVAGVMVAAASTLTTGIVNHLLYAASFALPATVLYASCVMTLKSRRDSRRISATHRLSVWLASASRQYDPSVGDDGTLRRRRRDRFFPDSWGGSTECYYCADRIFHIDGEWYAPSRESWVTALACAGQPPTASHTPVARDPLVRLVEHYG